MKGSYIAALCSTLLFAASCTPNSPLVSQALKSGSTISGTPYYLPKSYLRIGFDPNATPITTVGVENKPDPLRIYSLKADFSEFSKDKVTIQTTKEGLLESVQVDTDDQSDEIISTLTSGLSDIIAGREIEPLNQNTSDSAFSLLIDPFDPSLAEAEKSFGNDGELVIRRIRPQEIRDDVTVRCPADATICVPLLVEVKIEIKIDGQIFEHIAIVAHPRLVMGIRIDRHVCVRTKSVLMLKDGFLTKYEVEKPSEVAGCLSIPLDVISAVIAAPVDGLTGRKKRLEAETDLLEQQRILLEKEQELLLAQIKAANSN